MTENLDIGLLEFARGYILAHESCFNAMHNVVPDGWCEIRFGIFANRFAAFHDPRVPVTCVKEEAGWFGVLLGRILDIEMETDDAERILREFLHRLVGKGEDLACNGLWLFCLRYPREMWRRKRVAHGCLRLIAASGER